MRSTPSSEADPLTGGYTCPKERALPAFHHHPQRLDHPRLRGEPVTWDGLLDDLASRVGGSWAARPRRRRRLPRHVVVARRAGPPQRGTFTDLTAANGTQYFYVVQAVDTADHHSAPSNEKSATPNPFGGGHAVNLNGSSQYVRVPDPAPAPDALNSASFTLETWFRQTGPGVTTNTGNAGVAATVPLIARGRHEDESAAQDINYYLGLDNTGHLVADFEEAQNGLRPSQNHPVTGATAVTQNAWHHAAVSYDGTTWRLYLDGRLDAKLGLGAVPPNIAGTLDVGIGTSFDTTDAAEGFFQGDIDEARIWNVARTGAQIRANKDVPISAPTANLVGRWGFDEGAGPALDVSGNHFDGTLQGAARVSGYMFPADSTAPGAPQNLVATPGSASVALMWDPVIAPDLAATTCGARRRRR